jgi:hypothetical protein
MFEVLESKSPKLAYDVEEPEDIYQISHDPL